MAQKDHTQKSTAPRKSTGPSDPETREEAKHLAEEALQERDRGNKDEANFVLGQARDLDKAAADEVLKQQKKNPD
jgi:hypothetical protein